MPREQNTEADAITNKDFAWLSLSNRVDTKLGQLPFLMLPDLLALGESFYSGSETVNIGLEPKVKDPRSLRVRDPWDL